MDNTTNITNNLLRSIEELSETSEPNEIRQTHEQLIDMGKRLHATRKGAGLTQATVATLVGVTQVTISNYESNRTRITVDVLLKLAKAYKVDVMWLLTGRSSAEIMKSEDHGETNGETSRIEDIDCVFVLANNYAHFRCYENSLQQQYGSRRIRVIEINNLITLRGRKAIIHPLITIERLLTRWTFEQLDLLLESMLATGTQFTDHSYWISLNEYITHMRHIRQQEKDVLDDIITHYQKHEDDPTLTFTTPSRIIKSTLIYDDNQSDGNDGGDDNQRQNITE